MAIRSRFPSVLCPHRRCRKKCFLLVSLKLNTGVTDMTKGEEQGERPKFGPQPKFDSMDFDFKKELE